ncbi:hypothetical protein EDD17DRAFT_1896753 [Pisolithus thermaeus]|nr:hypothetical protein EDD17DRAFT_1896753 [Pisolithus thermaeus]
MQGEVKFYEHLIKHDVPHIAPLLCGGDVPRGETGTHKRAEQTDSYTISRRYLHRLVLGFVRHRLTQFKCTRELAVGIFHAMEAHWKAFEKARVLHRDISVNNILIDENGEGILVDWALAVLLDDQGDSSAIERHGRTVHTLQDDIESFVHVLGWTILCYLPGLMDEVSRREWVRLMYDCSRRNERGQEIGGERKSMNLQLDHYLPREFKLWERSPILELIQTLASPFRVRYCNPPTEADKRLYDFVRVEFSNGLLTEEMLNADSMHKYTLCVEQLKNSQWFLSILQDALERQD